MNGWIKLHRKLLTSDIFQNEKLLKIFTYCLLKATHSEHQQLVGKRKVDLKPGQFIFGRRKAALELDMKESTVRDYMNVLKDDNVITISPTNKYSVVTVVNWGVYQFKEDESRQQNDNKKTAEGQQNDTNKNVKNVKNVKNLSSSSLVDSDLKEVIQFYQSNLQAGLTESPHNQNTLLELYDTWKKDLLVAAMKLAAEQEKKGVAFLKGILNNWKEAGVQTLEDARKYEKDFRNSIKNNKVTPINRRKTAGEIDWDNL